MGVGLSRRCHFQHGVSLRPIGKRVTFGSSWPNQTPKSPIKRCSYGHETPIGRQNGQSGFGDFGDWAQCEASGGVVSRRDRNRPMFI